MARSSYVYVVQDNHENFCGPVLAAFTVKHECRSWIVQTYGEDPAALPCTLGVLRFADGRRGPIVGDRPYADKVWRTLPEFMEDA